MSVITHTFNPLPSILTCVFVSQFSKEKNHIWFFLLNVSFIRDYLIPVGSSDN